MGSAGRRGFSFVTPMLSGRSDLTTRSCRKVLPRRRGEINRVAVEDEGSVGRSVHLGCRSVFAYLWHVVVFSYAWVASRKLAVPK